MRFLQHLLLSDYFVLYLTILFFVIAAIFGYFAVPRRYQHRVLVYGILGVILLRGLMIGVDFSDEDGHPRAEFRDEIVNACYLNGLLTLACGSSAIRIAPPLMISQELMEKGLDIFERAIAEVEESHSELFIGR